MAGAEEPAIADDVMPLFLEAVGVIFCGGTATSLEDVGPGMALVAVVAVGPCGGTELSLEDVGPGISLVAVVAACGGTEAPLLEPSITANSGVSPDVTPVLSS